MFVICDKCGKNYQVNEARLPAQGARIKCPQCAHIFLVLPKANNAANASSSASTDTSNSAPAANETAADMAQEETWKIKSGGLPYTFHDLTALQNWLGGRTTLDDVKVAKGEDDWKELGDYPEVLTTELITKYFPLGDVPKTPKDGSAPANVSQEMPSVSSTPSVSQAPIASGMSYGVVGASKNTLRNLAKARSEENKRAQKSNNNIKNILAVVFALCCVVFMLHEFGVIDATKLFQGKEEVPIGYHREVQDGVERIVPDYVPSSETETAEANADTAVAANDTAAAKAAEPVAPEELVDPNANVISEQEAEAIVNAEIEKLLSQARENVKKRNWPVAQSILLSLITEHPESIEAKQLLVRTYRGLGQNDKADQLEADIKAMKMK